jgi:hypothetical protein
LWFAIFVLALPFKLQKVRKKAPAADGGRYTTALVRTPVHPLQERPYRSCGNG